MSAEDPHGESLGDEKANEEELATLTPAGGVELVGAMTPADQAMALTAVRSTVEKVPEVDGITVAQAERQATTLRKASRGCPVRQLRYFLSRLAREWEVAAATLEDDEEDHTIELVGGLAPGMRVPCRNKNGHDDVGVLIRVLIRDSQASLHLAPVDHPMDVYLNFAGTFSPVVVRR